MQNYLRFFLSTISIACAINLFAAIKPCAFNTKQPVLFMENKGQFTNEKGVPRPDVFFGAKQGDISVLLTANAIHYQITKTEEENKGLNNILKKSVHFSTDHFSASLINSNPHPQIIREGKSDYTENYFLQHCPHGITGVQGFEKIIYKNVYPHIDWIIYSSNGFIEYDFDVQPGGDANMIRIKINDAEHVSLTAKGELQMQTKLGAVTEKAPVSFDEQGKEIATAFTQSAGGVISFKLAPHKGSSVRIDPVVTWSTYYGDAFSEDLLFSCRDAAGNIYVTGNSSSAANIAAGGFQNTAGGAFDAILVKFNSAGARVWATYYGGSSSDYGYSCAVDNSGNIYFCGQLGSAGLATAGSYQSTFGGQSDAFLAKVNASGGLIWSTYYGGAATDIAQTCLVDAQDNVYLIGSTNSTANIASPSAFQTVMAGVFDAMIVKFNSAGLRQWGTYYGAGSVDYGFGGALDNSGGFIYVCGQTTSSSAFANSGWQNTFGGSSDAYLMKMDQATGSRIWCTYYGGSGNDVGRACAISGNYVYLAGQTASSSGIASGGFQNTIGGSNDGFAVKFDNACQLVWGTYCGGSGNENFSSCNTDAQGNILLAGISASTSGIPSGGFQAANAGGIDGLLVKLNAAGAVQWGSYFGGPADEAVNYALPDGSGNIYLVGNTKSSSGIATAGAYQTSFVAVQDGFIAKISDAPAGFTSITNGDWNNPATWSGGVVPSVTDAVIINSNVVITANTSCYSVSVNAGKLLTVNGGVILTVVH